jgi:3-isopropylmalate/(R)-2-methylmalate dehydratase small subunit
MKETIRKGRVWILQDEEGKLIEDIDTDQIFHNQFLHITEMSQMGQYALGNLDGWRDFSKKVEPGDILVVGRNFGAGSSRQQAVDCFLALGISLILASSFGAIYYRNAVNSGFPVLKGDDIEDMIAAGILKTGDVIEVDLKTGEGRNISQDKSFRLESMGPVQEKIFLAEGLFNYGKTLKNP